MLTINRLSIAALAFAGITLAAQPSFAGCRSGGCHPSYAPSYGYSNYRAPYPVQPCYQQPIYYPTYAPQYQQYPAFGATPFTAVAPAPVATNLPPAGPLANAPVAAQVIPNAPVGTNVAPIGAPVAANVLPAGNNAPPPGPLGSAPVDGTQVLGNIAPNAGPLPTDGAPGTGVAIPQSTPLTLPANPQAPRIEAPTAAPGPVGALTAYNVGVQGPVSNVQPGADLPILRSPRFEE